MRTKKTFLILPILALASIFCSAGLPEGLQATLESLTQQVPIMETQISQQLTDSAPLLTQIVPTILAQLTSTPEANVPAAGGISGNLSYPSEFIPPLRVVAFRVDVNEYYFLDTAENQAAYQIDNLPPGTYHVVAYTMDGGLAGGYTQAVPCGLSADCADHSLIDIVVNAGGVGAGINPGDWYAPEGAYPPKP
jgi:hypothetical protein